MTLQMHIVLAFFLSVVIAVLVLLNVNQYGNNAIFEGRRSPDVTFSYPKYQPNSGYLQVAVNPVYNNIKPYKSTSRFITQEVQQPGVISAKFSGLNSVSYNSGLNPLNSFNNSGQTLKAGLTARTNIPTGITHSNHYYPGNFNASSGNQSFNFRSSENSFSTGVQRTHNQSQTDLIAGTRISFGSSIFGSADNRPAFAMSDFLFDPLGIDPGGDPEDPGQMIPVPDGVLCMIFMTLLYMIVVFVRRS